MDLETGELFEDVIRESPKYFKTLKDLPSLKKVPELVLPGKAEDTGFDPKEVKTYVIGHMAYESQVFRRNGFTVVQNVDDADMVVWLGGEDISPQLYGERPIKQVRHVNPHRDAEEIAYWRKSVGKFKVGICRGGQLLNVLNGGTLWQHVTNHSGQHDMVDLLTGKVLRTSSVHHQAFRPTKAAEIVAVAHISGSKESEHLMWEAKDDPTHPLHATDYEVVFYPETRSLCFQGHPEYTAPAECEPYFFDLIRRYYPEQKKAAAA